MISRKSSTIADYGVIIIIVGHVYCANSAWWIPSPHDFGYVSALRCFETSSHETLSNGSAVADAMRRVNHPSL